MTNQLSIAPRFTVLPKGDASHLDLLVRLQAESAPVDTNRPTLNLCLCIDRSGSMQGDPLENAKAAAIHLVRQLRTGDQISVVSYGQDVRLVAEPMDAMQGRDYVIRQIQAIRSMGGTPLRAGWLEAAKALAPFQSKFGISRVLLLSDGQATDGSTPAGLAAEAAELRAAGITTSTYGLGSNFNEALMTQLGQQGGGVAFYAATASELIPYFESEFAMLSATVGRSVNARLEARIVGRVKGKDKALVVERLDTLTPLGDHPVALPALVAGAESWVALRVQLPKMGGKYSLDLTSVVEWESMDGQKQSLTANELLSVGDHAVETTDTVVIERLKEVEAARLQREVLKQAEQGNWGVAKSMLRGMSASAGSNAYIAKVAASLQGIAESGNLNSLSKEVAYSAYAMTNRVADVGEDTTVLNADRFNLRKASQSRSSK